MEREYLTKEKYEELNKELNFLRTGRRKEVAEHLEYAKQLGDLSENAEYHEARDEQANIEDRISKLETMLKNAIIVESHETDVVTIGSTVKVSKEGSEDRKTYTIVGSEEADMKAGKLSIKSPIGEAILGKKKGELFAVKTPGGEVKYKIIDIK
ncbi:MAG: transcription elongation factor GreA [bacterium]|nr:transcription elongation factor GreA [bacterium]